MLLVQSGLLEYSELFSWTHRKTKDWVVDDPGFTTEEGVQRIPGVGVDQSYKGPQ